MLKVECGSSERRTRFGELVEAIEYSAAYSSPMRGRSLRLR